MRTPLLALALLMSVGPALAEETIIEHERPAGPAVVAPREGVAVERGGVDCSSKTVHRESPGGSTTVHSSNCD